MRKDKSDQLLSPFVSSISIWNQYQNDQAIGQQTNLFSQKFRESCNSNDFDAGQTCPNHPNKKVKYLISKEDGYCEKLCTKCAVTFAQQKCKVEELFEDDVRKKQTDSFMNQLTESKTHVDHLSEQMQKTEIQIKEYYNEQYSQVVKTFSEVEKSLQICKSQILQNLSQAMWQAIQITSQLKVQAKQVEHQISTYLADIKSNYDNIVHHMGTLPFNQIMGGYGSKFFKLQQCIKQLEDKKIPYLHFEGKETCLQTFITEISRLREVHHDESVISKKEKGSTRSSSEQRLQKSNEQEKRHQSQPNRPEVNKFESDKKTFKITEESIEEWMENSSTKQKEHRKYPNLQTEPSESPTPVANKFVKIQKPSQRTSMRQETTQVLMDKLLEGFNQIKREREKKISKTPDIQKPITIQTKLSPKFLFKNYYK